ncbi:hypothetical protein AB0368_30770 [Actinoplanes sp. NPDC051475]|uniref:hypothetical protein n=1 Tax=Actinoplanes sp. NPDC051475 TaxID=3157225 RepID=UPI00344F5043
MTVIADPDTTIVEVTVSGRWDRRLHEASARILHGCLAAHSAAIIMDLYDLGDPSGASAAFWSTVRRWGQRMQPSTRVAACLPTQTPLAVALRRRGRGRDLPTYTSVPEGRAALINTSAKTDQPPRRLRLQPELTEVVRARRLLIDACARWQPSELEIRARLAPNRASGRTPPSTHTRRAIRLHR